MLGIFLAVTPSLLHAKLSTGTKAPDFTLTDTEGEQVSLSDFKGKFVVLEWTNHKCPFVVKHYGSGNMQGLQKKYTGKDVVWLTILSSAPGKQGYVTADEAKALMEENGAHPTHYLFDTEGNVGHTYDARTTPHMYVIDPQGTLVYQGAIDSIRSTDPGDIEIAQNYLSVALDEVMSGKEVSISDTRPYGCSVKYASK